MNRLLFVLSVCSLFSCGQSSNHDGAQIPKHDSTIVGIWSNRGFKYEFTPTQFIQLGADTFQYLIHGDSLTLIARNRWGNYDTAKLFVSFDRVKLFLKGSMWPDGISFNRYDPEEARKRAEKLEEALQKMAEEKKSERGNEPNGTIIDYCPMCGEDASQAYAVSNGILIEEPDFIKGASFVCYSCAKKLLKRRYNKNLN